MSRLACKVRFDDAGLYGCRVWVADPRDNKWHLIRKVGNAGGGSADYVAWDTKRDAERAARRHIAKIEVALGTFD